MKQVLPEISFSFPSSVQGDPVAPEDQDQEGSVCPEKRDSRTQTAVGTVSSRGDGKPKQSERTS